MRCTYLWNHGKVTRTHWLVYICGSLIAFVWEIFQMPFFKPGNLEPYEQTIRCGIASLVVAIAVEIMATSLPSDSLLSWRYSDLMPHEPLTGMALIPIAMWTIVPALTILLVRFAQTERN